MKKIIFLLLFLVSLHPLAAQRNRNEAFQYATSWLDHHVASKRMKERKSALREEEFHRAFVFQQGNTFVIVNKDEKLPPLLGYGRTSSLKQASSLIQQVPVLAAMLSQATKEQHTYPLLGTNWTPVSPLLSTVRHQLHPYNKYCPYYKDDAGNLSTERCMVGCVATAMEQILTYYRRTYTLQDTLRGWSTDHYTIPNVLPGESVDTRLILDNYDTTSATEKEEDAVGRLSYYLGVASHMNYGLNASGTNTSRLATPLRKAFGLKTVNYLDSYKYAPSAWWNYLAHEIMAHRPIYFSGSISSMAGHAFVLDGIDEDGLFHVNWGYGGNYDGYFRLDVLCTSQPTDERKQWVDDGYFCNQEAITLCPDEVTDNLPPDTLCRTGHEIAIDSLWLVDSAEDHCQTRIRIALHNTTNQSLTTSFALLLNTSTDTALIKQADWLAFTGCTLSPYERDTLTIHTLLTHTGDCLLSLSPDGEQIIHTLPIHVSKGGSRTFRCSEPTLSFPEEGTLCFSMPIANPSVSERAAWDFTTILRNDTRGTDVSKVSHIYLQPLQDTLLTLRFSSLPLECHYTLEIYRGWDLMQSAHFSLPTLPQGIFEAPSSEATTNDAVNTQVTTFYTLDGRRIPASALTHYHGVALKRTPSYTQKLILP